MRLGAVRPTPLTTRLPPARRSTTIAAPMAASSARPTLPGARDATPPTAPPGHAALVVPDAAAGAAAVAALVRSAADAAIAARGAFTLVLSGGSLVSCLAPLAGAPDAGAWHVFWADERVVPLDSADSNYKGAVDAFLGKVCVVKGREIEGGRVGSWARTS
jgi:6-phosphogluconolactonase